MDLEVTAPASIMRTAHLGVAGIADDLGPRGAAWLIRQRVPMAREGVRCAREVQVKIAVAAAVAGAPATTATTVTGEVAALVADQRAWMAMVVDHGASL
jgi:uncharacterized protein YhdP